MVALPPRPSAASPSSEYDTEEGNQQDARVHARMREMMQNRTDSANPRPRPEPSSVTDRDLPTVEAARRYAAQQGTVGARTAESRISRLNQQGPPARDRIREYLDRSVERDENELRQIERARSVPPHDYQETPTGRPTRPGSAGRNTAMTQELRALLNQVRESHTYSNVVDTTPGTTDENRPPVFPNLHLPDGHNTKVSALMNSPGMNIREHINDKNLLCVTLPNLASKYGSSQFLVCLRTGVLYVVQEEGRFYEIHDEQARYQPFTGEELAAQRRMGMVEMSTTHPGMVQTLAYPPTTPAAESTRITMGTGAFQPITPAAVHIPPPATVTLRLRRGEQHEEPDGSDVTTNPSAPVTTTTTSANSATQPKTTVATTTAPVTTEQVVEPPSDLHVITPPPADSSLQGSSLMGAVGGVPANPNPPDDEDDSDQVSNASSHIDWNQDHFDNLQRPIALSARELFAKRAHRLVCKLAGLFKSHQDVKARGNPTNTERSFKYVKDKSKQYARKADELTRLLQRDNRMREEHGQPPLPEPYNIPPLDQWVRMDTAHQMRESEGYLTEFKKVISQLVFGTAPTSSQLDSSETEDTIRRPSATTTPQRATPTRPAPAPPLQVTVSTANPHNRTITQFDNSRMEESSTEPASSPSLEEENMEETVISNVPTEPPASSASTSHAVASIAPVPRTTAPHTTTATSATTTTTGFGTN